MANIREIVFVDPVTDDAASTIEQITAEDLVFLYSPDFHHDKIAEVIRQLFLTARAPLRIVTLVRRNDYTSLGVASRACTTCTFIPDTQDDVEMITMQRWRDFPDRETIERRHGPISWKETPGE